jgi:excisionase family DNA binding protein
MAASTGGERRDVTTIVEADEWITYERAKQLSSLGITKLREIVAEGSVEAAKIGRAVRISRRSLDEYMRHNAYVGAGE